MNGVVLILLGVAQAGEAPVRPSPSPAHHVRSLVDLGTRAYRAGRPARAVESFLEVDALVPAASTAFNVAVAAHAAGDEVLAYTYFERCLGFSDVDARERRVARELMEQLAPRLALVEVITEPPGAEVAVGGWHLGTFGRSPLTLALVPGKVHRILVRKAGWHAREHEVEAKRGERRRFEWKLERRSGRLTITAIPPDARIRAVETATFALAAGVPAVLPTGTYRVSVERDGYVSESLVVTVGALADERRQVALRRVPAARGRLIVVSGAEPAEVLLDERRVATTPALLDLEVGSHEVRLERGGRVLLSQDVVIEEGGAAVVELGAESSARSR